MTSTLFTQLGLRALPEGAITPEPTLIVTDVDFTRDNITGQLTLDGYVVVVSQSFKTTRMGLWEFDNKLSDQAEVIALIQAERQNLINRERRP